MTLTKRSLLNDADYLQYKQRLQASQKILRAATTIRRPC